MPRISRRAAPWRILVLASVGLGCGVKSDSEGTGFGSEAADTGSGAGEPGAPCQVDTDCVGGGGCLPPSFFPDGDRVCGPPCMVVEDCAELAAADYAFEVGLASPGPDGNNLWNSSVLSRGRACDAGHCQFLCPEYGAVVYGDDDVAAGCACLPHFKFDQATSQCVWDEEVPCSILERTDRPNPCNPCNSEELYEGCSTGRFQCVPYTPSFAGYCVEWAASGEADLCAMGILGYDCDAACYSNCARAECTEEFCNVDIEGCHASCCVQTDTPIEGEGCGDTGGDPDDGENTPALCTDAMDNDGDGYTDCHPSFPDFGCCGVGICGCLGPCTGQGSCLGGQTENSEATCTDELDNDGDGTIDCDASFPDSDCCGVGSCPCTGACEGVGSCV